MIQKGNMNNPMIIGNATLYNEDCRKVLALLPDNSVDSIVTDPPYELGFMGKSWDSTGIAYDIAMWKDALRVLKPGGHLLAFSGSRTYHRMASAIEDAGFDVRDNIARFYSGKKDKDAFLNSLSDEQIELFLTAFGAPSMLEWVYGSGFPKSRNLEGDFEGWGTALKPAHEPICMARKPLSQTVAANVLEFGTGAINIDACRTSAGRWRANLIHDGSAEVLAAFPNAKGAQSDVKETDKCRPSNGKFGDMNPPHAHSARIETDKSAARFFYCAKASSSERDEGIEKLQKNPAGIKNDSGRGYSEIDPMKEILRANHHPTVKPVEVGAYFQRLVTPPGGTTLDMFMGSGSFGVSAILEGFNYIGIDNDTEHGYFNISTNRISYAVYTPKQQKMFA